jgi:hypothetical protein
MRESLQLQIMKRACNAVALLAISILSLSQSAFETSLTPNWVVQVNVKTDKNNYAFGEPIYVTATLTNVGNSIVYIAKTFFERGGGIAGFNVTVEQLTGKKSGVGCGGVGDRFDSHEARSPKQILQEDFLRLPPGAIVGYQFKYRGCVIAHPGKYQVIATYCACDLNTGRVRSIDEYANQIVTGELKSKPWAFRVRPGRSDGG